MDKLTGELEIYYIEYNFEVETEKNTIYQPYNDTDLYSYEYKSTLTHSSEIKCENYDIELDEEYKDKLVSGNIKVIYRKILNIFDDYMSEFKYAIYIDNLYKKKYYISFDDIMKFKHMK